MGTVCRRQERHVHRSGADADRTGAWQEPAQIALRFLLQSDVVVIPKSTHQTRMEENIDVFDFALGEEEMAAIQALDEGKSLFFDHYDPATVEMLTQMGKTRKA